MTVERGCEGDIADNLLTQYLKWLRYWECETPREPVSTHQYRALREMVKPGNLNEAGFCEEGDLDSSHLDHLVTALQSVVDKKTFSEWVKIAANEPIKDPRVEDIINASKQLFIEATAK